jgi:hypothetical protein
MGVWLLRILEYSGENKRGGDAMIAYESPFNVHIYKLSKMLEHLRASVIAAIKSPDVYKGSESLHPILTQNNLDIFK